MRFFSLGNVESTLPTKTLFKIIRLFKRATPDTHTYHYPLSSLDQPRFNLPATGRTELNFSVLADPKFDSPLCQLLSQLELDGHNVDGPIKELIALRDTVKRIDTTIREIETNLIRYRFK